MRYVFSIIILVAAVALINSMVGTYNAMEVCKEKHSISTCISSLR